MHATQNTVTAPSGQSTTTVHFLGNLLTFKARSADTGGSFSIVEALTAPGAGSPPHIQQDEEAFVVTEGRFEFMLDGEVRTCGPGEFLYVPPGTAHAFRNCADTPSKMLIFNLPGGVHEGFFLAVGDPVADGTSEFPPMTPPDIPFIAAAAGRFGISILPPQDA